MNKHLTNEEALKKINEKCLEKNFEFIGFNNKSNEYVNHKTYLILKCGKCGNIWNTTSYNKFISCGRGCPECSPFKKISKEETINRIVEKCKEMDFEFLGFNGKFVGGKTKLRLKCKKCGYLWETTTYTNFIRDGRKSHTCGRKNPSSMSIVLDKDKAVKKIIESLNDTSMEFVSFDDKGYIGRKKTHIFLKCKKCGEIIEYSYSYVVGNKVTCKKCEVIGKTSNDDAINKIHEKCKKLNYSFLGFDNEKNRYENKNTYLILKCNKCGIIWKSTTYNSFICNIIKCPGCVNSWKMEKEIEGALRENRIEFIQHCRNRTLCWLTNKISLSLDFYLPKYKIGIECQGRQHFEPVYDFGGKKTFEESIERDNKKLTLCKENGVKLLYYDSEHKHQNFLGEQVYNTKEDIIKEILK